MPVYEYVCQACEHPFEELVLGGETPACPACGDAEPRKRFSTFAVGDEARPAPAFEAGPGACGTCGDPRGPGACKN
jgi:putative FmdB family regulatory protein